VLAAVRHYSRHIPNKRIAATRRRWRRLPQLRDGDTSAGAGGGCLSCLTAILQQVLVAVICTK